MNKPTTEFDNRMRWREEGNWKGHSDAQSVFLADYERGTYLHSESSRGLHSTRNLALDQLRKDLRDEALKILSLFAYDVQIKWIDSIGTEQITSQTDPLLKLD